MASEEPAAAPAPEEPEATAGAAEGEGGDEGEDKKDNKPGGPTLPRTRVSTHQHLGQVWEWRGNYGWIIPFEPVRHPKASMRQGRIFVSRTDLANSKDLMPGTFVQFQIFEDEQGLGAEKCYVFKGPPSFLFKGKGKGKGKKGEGKGPKGDRPPKEERKEGMPEGAPAAAPKASPGRTPGEGKGKGGKGRGRGDGPGGKGGQKGDKGGKGDRRKGKGDEGGKGGKGSGFFNKGAGRGFDRDGGKGRGKPSGGPDRGALGGGPGQSQPLRQAPMPTPSQQQVPQPQLQPQLGMGGASNFGLMPGVPNLMEFPGASLGMSVPQGLQNLQSLPNLQGLQGLQNLQSLGLANPAWAAFVQPQVPARNMGAMPGTGPAGGMLPNYMDLGDNLRGLQGQQASYKGGLAGSGQGFMG